MEKLTSKYNIDGLFTVFRELLKICHLSVFPFVYTELLFAIYKRLPVHRLKIVNCRCNVKLGRDPHKPAWEIWVL